LDAMRVVDADILSYALFRRHDTLIRSRKRKSFYGMD